MAQYSYKDWRNFYLIPAFLIPVASIFGHYLAPNEPVLYGQDWGIVFAYLVFGASCLMWTQQSFSRGWSSAQNAFFIVAILTWIAQTLSTQVDQSVFNISAFLYPVMLVMIWLKRPTYHSLRLAFTTFVYGLLVISAVSLISGGLGLTANGFESVDSGVSRLPFLNELFGATTRWAGPFGSVNYAAPVGALLIVAGLTLRARSRWIITSGGVLILALSQGRTALFALAIALIVLLAYSNQVSRSRYVLRIRVALFVVPLTIMSTYVLLADRTLNGRWSIWQDFIDLFASDPFTGVGSSGILTYLEIRSNDVTFVPHNHAHSVLLDFATRYGILALLLAIIFFSLIFVISWNNRLADHGNGLALAAFVFTAGLSETIYSWQYLSTYLVVLTYIAIKNPGHLGSGIIRTSSKL